MFGSDHVDDRRGVRWDLRGGWVPAAPVEDEQCSGDIGNVADEGEPLAVAEKPSLTP